LKKKTKQRANRDLNLYLQQHHCGWTIQPLGLSHPDGPSGRANITNECLDNPTGIFEIQLFCPDGISRA